MPAKTSRDPAFHDESIDTCFIPLTKGKWAMVSGEDRDLAAHVWFAWCGNRRNWYARTNSTTTYLHRIVAARMGLDVAGRQVDHRNGNGLDNRRENLRAASAGENTRNARLRCDNASGFKGVIWRSDSDNWSAYITAHGKRRYLGRFATAEAAARAYDAAALKLHGPFARLNFPEAPANDVKEPAA